MSLSQNQNGQMISEVNVTPMVDIMLVLMIVFMVAAPMIEKEDQEKRAVEMDLPVTKENANRIDPETTDKFILTIDRNLKVSAGDTELVDCSAKKDLPEKDRFEPCFEALELKLGKNEKLKEQGELFLLADTEIPYGFVVGAMARIKRAGIGKIGMITNPEYLDEQPKKGKK